MENLGKLFAYVLECRENHNFFNARGQANNLYIGSKSIVDVPVSNFINNVLLSTDAINGWKNKEWLNQLEESYSHWLLSSQNNRITGLEHYRPAFSTGTTQGFDSFYLRHRTKKFKCLTGEYFYHLKSWISNDIEWKFIDTLEELAPGDAVVISVPFCDTGNVPVKYVDILNACEEKNIPVLVDCCYYSISSGVYLDLNYSCIDTVTFSLSKTFPVANLRIGMRYTKRSIVDGQTLHSDINYNHSFSAWVGCELIKKFSPDYIFDRYKDKQHLVCTQLKLTPSNTVMFASGDSSWDTYNRSTMLKEYQLKLDPALFNNRICLNSFYENWDLFERIIKLCN